MQDFLRSAVDADIVDKVQYHYSTNGATDTFIMPPSTSSESVTSLPEHQNDVTNNSL